MTFIIFRMVKVGFRILCHFVGKRLDFQLWVWYLFCGMFLWPFLSFEWVVVFRDVCPRECVNNGVIESCFDEFYLWVLGRLISVLSCCFHKVLRVCVWVFDLFVWVWCGKECEFSGCWWLRWNLCLRLFCVCKEKREQE